MKDDAQVKGQVGQFYNQIGWRELSEGTYQNASYEDLRPVARGYIHRCHLRVNEFLPPSGKFLLDAGSGPIQYPEYLSYSHGYTYRVCVDISIVALQEARKRILDHGLFVVADVANLPFTPGTFEGIVSLHTLHHLGLDDQKKGYTGFVNLLAPRGSCVVVNGWSNAALMQYAMPFVMLAERIFQRFNRVGKPEKEQPDPLVGRENVIKPSGTFVTKIDPRALKTMLDGFNYEIRCWRSVSVRFLRAMVHPWFAGRIFLRLLFWLENLFPHFFGEKGQYPLLVIRK